jgi:hypothetical protein
MRNLIPLSHCTFSGMLFNNLMSSNHKTLQGIKYYSLYKRMGTPKSQLKKLISKTLIIFTLKFE